MIRSLAVISLCAVALAQPALSAPYKDPSGRFDMTIPDGWTNVETKDVKEVGFVIGRENSAELPNGAACIGLFLETPDTRGRTQEELNNLFGEELTPDFWNKATKSTGKDEMTVLSTGTREQTGRKISYFVFTGTADDQGTKVQGKGKTEIHFVPGSVHFVMCVTNVANYDAMIAEFDAIFTSYVPRGGSSVVAGLERPAPSMLTMFAGPNFNGAARVLSQDTPNLAAAGWPTTSASLAVDGAAAWQVCERANYTGQCRTIKAAELAAMGQQITVASARRLTGQPNMQGLIATQLRRAMQSPAIRKVLGE